MAENQMSDEVQVDCPYCGEMIEVLVDPSEDEQEYIEDCSVCCKPIQFNVKCAQGEVQSIEVERS